MDQDLTAELRRVEDRVRGSAMYLFGSFMTAPDAARDIDLLAVCEDDGVAIRLREELRDLCILLPLHLLVLTQAEEEELKFVASQRCVRI